MLSSMNFSPNICGRYEDRFTVVNFERCKNFSLKNTVNAITAYNILLMLMREIQWTYGKFSSCMSIEGDSTFNLSWKRKESEVMMVLLCVYQYSYTYHKITISTRRFTDLQQTNMYTQKIGGDLL